MKFLKPTRKKVLIIILIGLIWDFFLIYALSFFGCTLDKITLPVLPGHTFLTPTQLLYATLYYGNPLNWYCFVLTSNIQWLTFSYLFLFPFVVFYVIASIILFLFTKLKKGMRNKKK
jgi:hypothetical protein